MDQRIFDQLDMLERGARTGTHQTQGVYNDSSADYSAYEAPNTLYGEASNYDQGFPDGEDGFDDQPMTFDSFDEQLLRQPDYNSRHGQAALGQARLSLPRGSRYGAESGFPAPQSTQQQPAAPRFDLSRFGFDDEPRPRSSSSPFNRPLPSSPAFNASQRRPALVGDRYGAARPSHSLFEGEVEHANEYEPFSVEQLHAEERFMQTSQAEPVEQFQPNYKPARLPSIPKAPGTAPPVVQGISLVSTRALPDRFRAIFSYPLFNAVQSKTFDTIYKTNENLVLSAPTGSGKTAVLELAICRLVNNFAAGSYKIVYQAPTKSLCSERQRDWQAKFAPFDLQCAELTGDTDGAQLRNVQHASIIVTTPEKWDSITRKWKDHRTLMQMVKLFLIDEVHILKDDRGATLEAVVSRMKSIGSDVRFVALSATVPNSDDIATWLGKDAMEPHVPATREKFGEEFRPVKLRKHVCGYPANSNDFAFEKTLNAKIPEVISKHSQRKPIMVFCFTRNACLETAKLLANWWTTKGPRERYWSAPRGRINVVDKDLKDTISSGVAFHHAGLSIQDRGAIEKGYLEGEVNVICCTSTLAVGVNLPCHMVIIKNTVTYHSNAAGGCKEYSDLEIMQMLGRAGRPQFDDNAVAIIMTRLQRVPYYEKMISGEEVLESRLHCNLIDHLNAEIGLGTVTGASSARKWLSSTFLYVRLKDNPEHYKIEGDVPGRHLDERLEHICSKGIALLEENNLVRADPKLQCTEFGDAMARYYLQFETMKRFMALPPKSKVSEILSAISQAAEFKDIRFRAGEKNTYKELNKNTSIKFPLPVNPDPSAHKVSLIIQSVLGAIDFPSEDYKQRIEYNTAKATIFQHVHRLVRCIIDCQLYLEDAITTRNALMLARSLGAQVWDDSPLHMKQLESVGLVSVRKLAGAGIKSIEDIETTEAHRLEQVLSRNPPYGLQLQDKAKTFPKLRVSVKMVGEPFIKKGEHVTIKVKAEIGFLNEKVPEMFQRKPVYVCFLAETSDGRRTYFARISAKKLNNGQEVLFSANLTSSTQSIRTYVMCDEIAGSMRYAVLKPEIPPLAFPPSNRTEETKQDSPSIANAPNSSKRRASAGNARAATKFDSDEFGDDGLDDADLAQVAADDFVDIDDFDDTGRQPKKKKQKTQQAATSDENWEPQQLPNGKWACKHACNDKTSCKHLCCREGLDKKPKPPKAKESKKTAEPDFDPKQTQLNMAATKKAATTTSAAPSTGKLSSVRRRSANESREAHDLNRLHSSVKSKTPKIPVLGHGTLGSGAHPSNARERQPRLSFLDAARDYEQDTMSDYALDNLHSSDLLEVNEVAGKQETSRVQDESNLLDPSLFDPWNTGNADELYSQGIEEGVGDGHVDLPSYAEEYNFDQDEMWSPFDEGPGPLPQEQTARAPHQTNTSFTQRNKDDNLFRGFGTDSAAEELDLNHNTVKESQFTDTNISSRSNSFPPQDPHLNPEPNPKTVVAPRTPSTQLREEAENARNFFMRNDFFDDVAEAAEGVESQVQNERTDEGGGDVAAAARATEEDDQDLKALFEAEFGNERFRYVG